MQLGAVNGGLIGFYGAIELADLSLLGVHLLLGDYTFSVEQFETLEIGFRVFALGLIFCQRAFGLLQNYLKRSRINLREHITLVNELPFLEGHAD